MYRRGYTDDYLASIEAAVPKYELRDVEVIARFLDVVHANSSKIVVLPDYDMDGIMSGVIGLAGLTEMGFNAALYVPQSTGTYGITEDDVKRIISQHPDVAAIITADVGSDSDRACICAKSRGVHMLITDHHVIKRYPRYASAFVNPMRVDDMYEHKQICGAFVLWQVLDYYARTRFSRNVVLRENISRLRVFAGIGTVSDSMPMLYENRQLVRDSIAICRSVYSEDDPSLFFNMLKASGTYIRAFHGLYHIISTFRSLGKLHDTGRGFNEAFYGYYVAPVFNSARRMNEPIERAFDVFFGVDAEQSINMLIELNEKRKELVEKLMDDLLSSPCEYEPYIYINDDIPRGVTGLIATKLMSISRRPCIVLARNEDGSYGGSLRSPEWYSIMDACSDLQDVMFSGHVCACGVSVQDDTALYTLYERMRDTVDVIMASMPESSGDEEFDAVIAQNGGDTWIDIDDFFEFASCINSFRPFGKGFTEPRFIFKFEKSDVQSVSYMGSLRQHVALSFESGFRVIGWNQAVVWKKISGGAERFAAMGCLEINEYNDVTSVQFVGNFEAR